MESLKLVVIHPWFVLSRQILLYCVCHNSVSDYIKSLATKLTSISSCVIFQLFQEAMVSLKKQSFLDPICKKRYMMPDATIFSVNDQPGQIDKAVLNG